MSRKVDMHLHTYASDGQWSPEEVIENLDINNIKIFSITDHDEVGCTPKITEFLVDRDDLIYIKGVEGTVSYKGIEHHILTYYIDETNETLLELIAYNRAARDDFNDALMDWLSSDYPHVSANAYKDYVYDPFQGGWRAFGYLQDAGVVTDLHDYFAKTKGFHFVKQFLLPEDYIPEMAELGFKTVLAHPPAYTKGDIYEEEHLDYFRELGLSGIECYTTYLKNPSNSQYYVDYCNKHNMMITGGSDCHGGFASRHIGQPDVNETMVRLK